MDNTHENKPLSNKDKCFCYENLAETVGISALMIANEHAKIAFSNVAHLHNTWIERNEFENLTDDQKACIQEITIKTVKANIGIKDAPIMADVEYVRIKTYDKQKSLDALSDLLGYKAASKMELTGKNGMAIESIVIVLPSNNRDDKPEGE